MKKETIGIIGGGLCGLTLASKLKKAGFSIKLLEANDRFGGRIFTKDVEGTKVELGATWLWRYNKNLIALGKELNIDFFEQQMDGDALFEAMNTNEPQRFQLPPNQEISYRTKEGTFQFIEKLAGQLTKDEAYLDTKVLAVIKEGEKIKLTTATGELYVDKLVSTLPPQLLVNTISFVPELPEEIASLANTTHTWMQDSIKCAVVFKSPFWKSQGLSGVGFSHVGPFTELYDHTSADGKTFALMGFLNGRLAQESQAIRQEKVLKQLHKFFGEEVKEQLVSYEEKVWNEEPLTLFPNATFLSPHQNNGHPGYQKPLWGNTFFIAGTETASDYAGYMEGAVIRALEIVKML